MNINIILSAIEIGFILSIMSFGIYITFTILNFADLTVDGSFTLGAVVSALCTIAGHPILGLLLATICGAIAGFITGFLHTKMKVQYILAGILTMTGLYSINLRIAGGRPNLSLYGEDTIFSIFETFLLDLGIMFQYSQLLLALIIVGVLATFLLLFFKTQTGMAIRATGDNEHMVRASSINSDVMKMVALAIANALVALCASIFTQYQLFYDVSSGIGMMVVGLTGIIVGQSIFGKRTLFNSFISIILGAIFYRFLLAFALSLGMNATDWKLLSACLVAITISIPHIKHYVLRKKV